MSFFLLIINFVISWFNAKNTGKIWTESKHIGGAMRVTAIAGYTMAIAGFTLVYVMILMIIVSYAGPATGYMSASQASYLTSLIGDMSYILIATAIIPSGIIITINSIISFWRRKSLVGGGIAAWNTIATARNVMNATRAMPSAFGRIIEATKKQRGNGAILMLALAIVLLAVLGGYFTASAIVKKADREYDLFQNLNQQPLPVR
ncbi:MAG: hypothetical protein LBN22_06825 [Clostridiales Family XIII bacterium]|nr:hypothetical protein [Clostridiales Family XIII bacterium]